MKVLLLGKNGQAGWELQRSLAPLGDVVGLDIEEMDLTDIDAVRATVRNLQPQVIVNASAYTNVDRAEEERDIAHAINATAPGVLAEEANRLGAVLIHYSTDYVFNGRKGSPYVEQDVPDPLGVYGRTKLEGERAIEQVGGAYLIFRTSWVYSLRKKSFLTQVLRWAREQKVMRVVDDQVGSPTWCGMLAETTASLVSKGRADHFGWLRDRTGIYHVAGKGQASRLAWAQEILRQDLAKDEHLVGQILPTKTSEFPSLAERPAFSALCCDHFETIFGIDLPDWKMSLERCLRA
jgi:dTDP-4-dehydrorhamnose reductase